MPTILQRAYQSTLGVCRRHDLTPWDHQPKTSAAVYGVYHVWCASGWERMVSDQMKRLRESGLLAHTKKLFVSCIVKDSGEAKALRSLLGDGPIEIISVRTDGTAYEFPALEYIHNLSQKEDFLFYYFHTKGISYQSLQSDDHLFLGFRAKIEAWRQMMEYFLMDCWQMAVNVLSDGYDTYGCYLFPPFKNKMYAGNFWWARSDYFRTLPPLDQKTKSENRFMAEEWLLSTGKAKAFSAFDTVADLYDVRMDGRQYKRGESSTLQSLRFFLVYTLRKYQKKWLHYSYKHRCQSRFQQLAKR